MQTLQEIGRLLVESKPQQALEALLQWVNTHLPDKAIEVQLQLSRVNLVSQDFAKGLITVSEYQTNLVQINNGILLLLEECKKESELAQPNKEQNNLHEYHAYTCDRVEHSDSFRTHFNQTDQQLAFYFLYGGDMQSHEGFFRRIAYDLEGRLMDYLNPEVDTRTQALQLEMTFEYSHQLDLYKQNILRSFYSMLGLQANEHQPLLDRDLAYVLEHSPRVQGLKASDYICAYLHISQYDWDSQLTPEATRWFVQQFCRCDLSTVAPRILFFFAIEYDEEDEDLRAEVKAAMETAEELSLLPELGMVPMRDLGRWMERYKQLSPNSRARKELIRNTFGTEREFYMEDVELELKKIIDNYNNQRIS